MEHYGLAHLWHQGDPVIRALTLALVLMSTLSWTVILAKTWQLICLRQLTKNAEQAFWHADGIEHGIEKLGKRAGNPFLALVLAGQEAASHHQQNQPSLHHRMDISDWITRCLKSTLDENLMRLQSGLALLASIGSTAPFVGLFGTVWGIYHALLAISENGQASLNHVAGPVGEALIMTALGLFVAIPATLAYNAFTRSNKRIVSKLNRFSHGLHAYFVTGARLRSNRRSELKVDVR